MFFDELNDDEWALIAPIVCEKPAICPSRRGRPRAAPRVVGNAILWILTTGESWSRLPGRYPSVPTCRSRFEEWFSNGTLGEMIQLLSQSGRTFAYTPEPSLPLTGPPSQGSERRLTDDGLPSVEWKNPESWQASTTGMNGRRSIDPFAQITLQLCGQFVDAPTGVESRAVIDKDLTRQTERPGGSLWMGLTSLGLQVADRRGYVIYVAADPVESEFFRAWAEIIQSGRRIARSGLIGSYFSDLEAAQKYALEWACKWIDKQGRTA